MILLVYAWSSVYFALPAFYTRAMQLVSDFEQPVWARSAGQTHEYRFLRWGWELALQTGQRLMSEQALGHNFSIERPLALYHFRDQGIYEYRVRSTREYRDTGGSTEVYFDARSGELKN